MKSISFSSVKFDQLAKVVDIHPVADQTVFAEWFGYDYQVNEHEKQLLHDLIEENQFFLLSYSEDELKMKFLAPLLNAVHFHTGHIRDWYQRPLKATINNVVLKGYTDFMVAAGFKEPGQPYFFIQEFKKSKIDTDPEDQLLAEMLVAMTLNPSDIMRGAYIIAQQWRFVILRRIGENSYRYYVSLIFDSANIEDLQRIYRNLQAVKDLFCHEE